MARHVAILMGSENDLSLLGGAFEILEHFGVGYSVRVISAHRTPDEASTFAAEAERNGYKVIICAAGMAAHLGGVIAAHTTLPVIGIPIPCEPFNGLDALLAMVQMPPGIPVGVVSSGKPGARNAALYAISMLALSDAALAAKLKEFRKSQSDKVRASDKEVSAKYGKG